MYSSRKAAAVRLPGAPSAAANIRNPGYRPAYSYWPGCQPLRAGTQSVSPPDNSFLIRKSPLHSHAKGESPRYHLYLLSRIQNDPQNSISSFLTRSLPGNSYSYFTIPAPKLPSIFAFPDRLPACDQSSLKVQKMYSSSSQPFLYSMEQVSLSAACSISRSFDFSGRSYII